jgi:3-deoxy-D-manno-octulosonate 8-phosphate phosphatase (KDO 8-P phosphatase)
MENFKTKLTKVKTFVFDIDGVLTDGTIAILPSGEQVRTMHTKDGYAMQLAIKKGYAIVIISGGKSSEQLRTRFHGLGITDVYLGVDDKVDVLNEYKEIYGIDLEETLYMGDDIPDYDVLKMVGVPTCPKDAVSEIKDLCIYISDKEGGRACVRDVIEQVMRAQGKWQREGNVQSI